MRYAIKIDYAKASKAAREELLVLLNRPNIRTRVIYHKEDVSAIVRVPVFDYLQYELDYDSRYSKTVKLTLCVEDPVSKKVSLYEDPEYDEKEDDGKYPKERYRFQNISIKSKTYKELLRKIRY